MAGTFVSNRSARQLNEYVSSNHKLDRIQLTPGEWKVRYAVAYGYEIESVNGHASIATTQRYTHVTKEHLIGVLRKRHPSIEMRAKT